MQISRRHGAIRLRINENIRVNGLVPRVWSAIELFKQASIVPVRCAMIPTNFKVYRQ